VKKVPALVERKKLREAAAPLRAKLAPEEAASAARWSLPAYTNAVYRSLKSIQDGRGVEALLDAAESVNYLLTALFSIHGRVRPYNKYLRWELERHPIGGLPWTPDELLGEIEDVVTTACPETQRALFSRLEALSRERGFGSAFEEWRPAQLDYIRGGRDEREHARPEPPESRAQVADRGHK
jgi:hypothetical protein